MKLSKEYIAGITDGEGSISIYQRREKDKKYGKNLYFTPVFKIGMTGVGKEVVKKLQDMYGGDSYRSRYKNTHYKELFTITIKGKKLEKFIEDIGDLLIVKRAQVLILKEFFAHKTGQKEWKTNVMPLEEIERRKKLYEKIKILNHRGLPKIKDN